MPITVQDLIDILSRQRDRTKPIYDRHGKPIMSLSVLVGGKEGDGVTVELSTKATE